ncbi:MAG: hypothetical protein U0Q16_30840 [Bryobacteraceae bacterium]
MANKVLGPLLQQQYEEGYRQGWINGFRQGWEQAKQRHRDAGHAAEGLEALLPGWAADLLDIPFAEDSLPNQ